MPRPARGGRAAGSSTAKTKSSSVSSRTLAPPRPPSVASRASPAIDVPLERPDNALRTQVCAIFRDAQRNTASHRKLAVKLRKLQERACYHHGLGLDQDGTPRKVAKKSVGGGWDRDNIRADDAAEDEGVFNEETFNSEFSRCVLRVMPVRKSESAGEKTARFIGLFTRHAQDKDNELAHPNPDEDAGDDYDASIMPETPTTRLVGDMMDAVLPLLTAKDKFVRYRAAQLISHVINSLDAIDDDLFQKLRRGLLKRIRDKEAMVRAQAVLGLGRMVGNTPADGADEDGSDADDAETSLLNKLLGVLQNDPSADVRRSLLINLPILPSTLPHLLARARDQDMATRRAVYARLLPALGDFRHLSLSMREKLLRWGLRDRDENVRKAAQRLFRERWIEDCVGPGQQQGPEEDENGRRQQQQQQQPGQRPPNFDALQELLERIDVVNSGVENGVALEAMHAFWEGRPDYRDAVVLDDAFWETLSAESVFMARSFNDFCRGQGSAKYESLVDEKLPEVTRLAFYLDRYIQALVAAIKRISDGQAARGGGDDDDEEEEEDTVEQEFIVEQLLHIALTLDYSDEVGRRKMFSLLRQALSVPTLPDEVTRLVIAVLRDVCGPDAAGEKEFCSVVLESVADVHDTILDDPPPFEREESFHSARSEVSGGSTPTREAAASSSSAHGGRNSNDKNKNKNNAPDMDDGDDDEAAAAPAAAEKAIKEIVVNMKCLHIVQCMLCNVAGNLQDNDHLVSMLNNLVVPAVRSHEAPVRERGLVCLGLCSLLDRSLAEENSTLFVHFFAKGHAALQITALQILTDILNVHGAALVVANPALLKVYTRALRLGSRAPDVQAAATVAVSKLLLGRVITDRDAAQELLRSLVVAYFDPSSAENQSVRQALNYFLPVFCYSRPENQDLMRAVALDALHALHNIRDGLEDDDADVDDVMVGMPTIGACLVDWTDPRKCYVPGGGLNADAEKKAVNGDVHLQFAQDILAKLEGNLGKDERKIVAGLLGKLHISPGSSVDKLREAYADVCDAVEENLIADTTGKNALYKIHANLGRIVNALDGGGDAVPASASASTSAPTPMLGSSGAGGNNIKRASRSVSVASSIISDDGGLSRERSTRRSPTVARDEGTRLVDIDEEEGDSDGTVVQGKRKRDSLVEDLLSDAEQ